MTGLFDALGTLAVVAAVYLIFRKRIRAYVLMRGDRVVACPDNGQFVGVRVDATHAALSAADSPGHLRLESCTRWPEKAGCGQECLRQIEAQPVDCLVRTQVTQWYTDKTCAICGKAVGLIDWTQQKPALRGPDGRTVQWHDVRPEALHDVLATHDPVCFTCHVAETFRREQPGLVIDDRTAR
jgi:hypothetical protein